MGCADDGAYATRRTRGADRAIATVLHLLSTLRAETPRELDCAIRIGLIEAGVPVIVLVLAHVG